mgnify:CR=1 FL=1
MASSFTILGLTGSPYGLTIAISVLVYLLACGVFRYLRGLPSGATRLYGVIGLPLALIVSRLTFCVCTTASFTDMDGLLRPQWFLRFWDGGYSMLGMLAGLFAAMFLASRIQKVRFGNMADAMAAPLGLLLCGLRLAEGLLKTMDGEMLMGYGSYLSDATLAQRFPWLFIEEKLGNSSMSMLAVYRLEAIVGLLMFLVMLALFLHNRKDHAQRLRLQDGPAVLLTQRGDRLARPGDIAMLSFSLIGATQVILESLRNDGHMMINFAVHASQILAVLMPVCALVVFSRRYIRIHHKRLAPTLCWVGMLLAMGGVMLMEFTLDGRLRLMEPNHVRDYCIMGVCCLAIFGIPLHLWHTLKTSVYREDRIGVRLPKEASME